ncbi:MAG: hypothetical protein DRI32_07695 [Chloroflexi bacterium]|nr:MAG: hypothetical protein DRI32_07695 [Chloroflexota bacterium]
MEKDEITQKLEKAFAKEKDYLPILETLAIVGVADTHHLQITSEQARDKLRRSIDKLEALGCVHAILETVHRKTGRGRRPQVWRLGEAGALFLDTRPGKLESTRAITHALGMLDFHLAADQAEQKIQTDKVITFENGALRPDHLVEAASGEKMLFEIEQDAGPRLLRRLVRSLRNKIAFFESPQSAGILPSIRMLVALPKGTEYDRTLGTWHQALDILIDERGGASLPFQLFALPLNSFLDRPDWDEEPASARWTVLTAQAKSSPQKNGLSKYLSQIPKQKAQQDRIILAALLQSLRENDKIGQKARRYPTPDPNFFGGIATIYTASHGEDLSEIEQAAFPWASLFLLKHYLHLHPLLRKSLSGRLSAGSHGMNWNTTIILHRMQTIIDIFLAYHGWRSNGPLLAFATTPPWNKDDVRTFRVRVKIRHSAILLSEGEGLRPRREEIKVVETSLAWVLTALFRYSPDLGFKSPPFW